MALEKQFSIFVENKIGSLSDVCSSLAGAQINIRAISVVDDLEWGIIRLIVDDVPRTTDLLQKLGLMFGESQVLVVEVPNHAGALAEIFQKLAESKINIDQAYATATGEKTILVLSTTNDYQASGLFES